MTPEDWWTRLVYEDPTPVHDLRANHLSKRNVALARHLYESHDIRFDRQVPYDGLHAQHNEEHQTTNAWLVPHPHPGVQRGS
jgi:hypothetical protein